MNNNVRIVPFHPEHVKLMDIRDSELEVLLCFQNIEQRLKVISERGVCGTIMWGNTILGVMGYIELWKGVCEVWVIPSKSIPEHSIVFAKRIKKSLRLLRQTKYFHRIQTASLSNKEQDRFFTWLGFKYEGDLACYSSKKETYKMWAIVEKE